MRLELVREQVMNNKTWSRISNSWEGLAGRSWGFLEFGKGPFLILQTSKGCVSIPSDAQRPFYGFAHNLPPSNHFSLCSLLSDAQEFSRWWGWVPGVPTLEAQTCDTSQRELCSNRMRKTTLSKPSWENQRRGMPMNVMKSFLFRNGPFRNRRIS